MDNEFAFQVTFPLWLNVILGLTGLHLLLMAIIYSSKSKIVSSFNSSTHENKTKIIDIYSRWLKYLKFILWLLPINLFIIPYIFYLYVPEHFIHITVFMSATSVSVIVNYIYRKALLNALET